MYIKLVKEPMGHHVYTATVGGYLFHYDDGQTKRQKRPGAVRVYKDEGGYRENLITTHRVGSLYEAERWVNDYIEKKKIITRKQVRLIKRKYGFYG